MFKNIRLFFRNIREDVGDEDPIDYLMELGKEMLVELAFAWEGFDVTQTDEKREEGDS